MGQGSARPHSPISVPTWVAHSSLPPWGWQASLRGLTCWKRTQHALGDVKVISLGRVCVFLPSGAWAVPVAFLAGHKVSSDGLRIQNTWQQAERQWLCDKEQGKITRSTIEYLH